jgi:hypothetical protein
MIDREGAMVEVVRALVKVLRGVLVRDRASKARVGSLNAGGEEND